MFINKSKYSIVSEKIKVDMIYIKEFTTKIVIKKYIQSFNKLGLKVIVLR